MKNNLVFSNIEDTFSSEANNIVFNENLLEILSSKNLKHKKIEHHWDIKNKINDDYEYISRFFYSTLDVFTEFLNNYHKLNENKYYWQIIIGPYLAKIIPILWDRWESIRVTLKNQRVDEVISLNFKYSFFVPNDFSDFWNNYPSNHKFNYYLYLEVINYLNKKKNLNIKLITKDYINLCEPQEIKRNKNNYFYNLYEYLLKFKKKKQKYLLTKTYLGQLNNLKLNLLLKNLPFRYSEFDKKYSNNKIVSRDKLKINVQKNNDFEKFFYSIILKILPISYLENFKTIQKSAVSLNLYPKIIFTSTLHVVSDVFKIWVSGRVKKGSKLILSDHGFYLEDEIDFNLWKKIAYKYVKWNLTEKKNCYQLPPNILLGRKKLDVVKNNNNFLIVLNSEPFYLKSFNFSKQPLAVYKNMKKFVHLFDKTKKKNFYFRPHPTEFNWRADKNISNDFGKKQIDNNKNFFQSIRNYKLIINTVPLTTFLETMFSGKPSIVLEHQSFVNLHKDVKELIVTMKDNKIIFNDIELAKKHLINIWDNPLEWWNSKKILSIRSEFQRVCSLKTKDDFSEWYNFLKKL